MKNGLLKHRDSWSRITRKHLIGVEAGILRTRYLVYVTRAEDGSVDRVHIPMRYVYVLIAAAVTGMFTIAGMAGSYSRMLAKAETINHLRDELAMSRQDYAHLEKSSHEKDVQMASLGSLAGEVSAIYGLTAGKLSLPYRHSAAITRKIDTAKTPLKDDSDTSEDSYYKSLDTFHALQQTAMEDDAARNLLGLNANLNARSPLSAFDSLNATPLTGSNVPNMWPVLGPINSGFGERIDPILGNGVGEFHKGVDIGAPDGTPVHAPANGRVIRTGMESGYGRIVEIDHGNGITTLYGHLSGWNVVPGQMVVKGQVIAFVGHSGRVTGSHLHYEVQVHGVAVNPHRYLRTTMAQLGDPTSSGGM
jgi:murein DD-endopeptidase MepM/ murein hydrolase activator NlpD